MEQVAEYIEAIEVFEAAKANLGSMTKAIQNYAHDLQARPKDAFFFNASIAPPSKPGVHVIPESQVWDAKDWPSADEINRVLLDYVQTEQRVKAAWQSMPANVQAAMKAPKFSLG